MWTRCGEIDIVASRDDVIAFVEVKTRRSTAFGQPAEAVDQRKAEHIRRTVAILRRTRGEMADARPRIDIIEVLWPEGESPRIRHLEDAIDGGRWA